MTEKPLTYFFIEEGEYSYRCWNGIIKTDADKDAVKKALSTYIPYPDPASEKYVQMRYPQSWEEVITLLKSKGFVAEWIGYDNEDSINLDYDIPQEERKRCSKEEIKEKP